MSEEDKSLGEEAKDAFENAKDSAENAAEKVGEKASELKEDAKEFAEDAKEKAGELVDDAKEAAKEFTEDAKKALSNNKTIAIIAHLTIIGWIIAFVMNNDNKTELGSFYIRQALGIMLLGLLSFIPFLGLLIALFGFILWIISFIGALSGDKKTVFLLGEQFQDWFKSL